MKIYILNIKYSQHIIIIAIFSFSFGKIPVESQSPAVCIFEFLGKILNPEFLPSV